MPMKDGVQMTLNLLGWICLQNVAAEVLFIVVQYSLRSTRNSGLKKERGARGRHACLSTRTCLPLARPFVLAPTPAPKYFQAPATQALLHLDEAKYYWQKNNSPTINYNRCHSSS